jgi:tRNA pseudouridine-54 N-methylase
MIARRAVVCGLVASLSALQCAEPALAAERRLPDGTRIPVRVMQQISSATVKDSDPVNFAVVEDVVVDGQVVIKQGTPVRGVIVDAAAKRRMGRAGRLSYSVNETKAVDRSVVRLRAVQDRQGDSNVTSTAITTTAVAVFVPVAAPFFLLRQGKDIVVPEGTRIDTFVDGDHVIATAVETEQSAAVTTSRATRLTNADVVALHKAGFGEELILAKIAASPTSFSVDSPDLVALKKAGVSERVIAAMVSAR